MSKNVIPFWHGLQKAKKQPVATHAWNGHCHGCEVKIYQSEVAQIGPYWICDGCIRNHFPNDQYSVNEAADILQTLRGR